MITGKENASLNQHIHERALEANESNAYKCHPTTRGNGQSATYAND